MAAAIATSNISAPTRKPATGRPRSRAPAEACTIAVAASAQLVRAFHNSLRERTANEYHSDLVQLAEFLHCRTVTEAVRSFCGHGARHANRTSDSWLKEMSERGLSPATCRRRLGMLRSLVRFARVHEYIAWHLDTRGPKVLPYRDTRGPGEDGMARILLAIDERQDRTGARDGALVRLLYLRGLRISEALGLDLVDLDLDNARIKVLGKGRDEKEWLSISPSVVAALRGWITYRGVNPGPLFLGQGGGRLGYHAARAAIVDCGRVVGLRIRTHGLRHAGITASLDRTNGNVRAVRHFSRHGSLNTIQYYEDNREDLGGEVARLLDQADPAKKR